MLLPSPQHGRVFTWGEGTYGKLGYGDHSIRTSPVDITSNIHLGSMEKVKQVSLGDYHSLAVTSTGRLFGWGALGFGEIGSFSRKIQSLPKNITSSLVLTTDEKVIGASAGTDRAAAITSTGRLLTWGSNSEGQLGDGTSNYRGFIVDISSKIRLHQDEIILRIEAAGDHTVALTSDGLAFAWGSNEKGQLGNGTRGPRATPTPVLFNSFVIDKVVKCHENDPIDYSPTKAGFIFDGWYQDTKLLNLYKRLCQLII